MRSELLAAKRTDFDFLNTLSRRSQRRPKWPKLGPQIYYNLGRLP